MRSKCQFSGKYETTRKLVAAAKFYYFDLGVQNYLLKRQSFDGESEVFGKALEHLVGLELRAYISYLGIDEEIHFSVVLLLKNGIISIKYSKVR